jgi:hypothetical protein
VTDAPQYRCPVCKRTDTLARLAQDGVGGCDRPPPACVQRCKAERDRQDAARETAEQRIGGDLANVASDRAAQAVRDALGLCTTDSQRTMVVVAALSVVGAQACAVFAAHTGKGPLEVWEVYPAVMEALREAKGRSG